MASIRDSAGGKYEVRRHDGNFYCRVDTFEEAISIRQELSYLEPKPHAHTVNCRKHKEFLCRPLQTTWLRRRWGPPQPKRTDSWI